MKKVQNVGTKNAFTPINFLDKLQTIPTKVLKF